MPYLLALDQGTTSSRAIVYDDRCKSLASAQKEFTQHFPERGGVEHAGGEIWQSVRDTSRSAISQAGGEAKEISAIGIPTQREPIVVGARKTGEPVAPAIVWQ